MLRAVLCLTAVLMYPALPAAQEAPGLLPLLDVPASAETVAVQGHGDAADDAEIWRNDAEPEKSLIFATDKKFGLFVLDLAGKPLHFFSVGRLNNVDLRGGWQVDGKDKVLIGVSNRTRLGISFFQLDPQTGEVVHLEESFLQTDLGDPYGLCMYRSRANNALYALVTGKDGSARQFELTARPGGGVDSRLVRSLQIGSVAEGCVADDRTGTLYIAEETRGVWRYGAEPERGDERTLIAQLDGGNFVDDLEGVTLAPQGDTGGHLIVSVQGANAFAVISLPEEKLIGRFHIAANTDKGIDDVTETDGVAVALGRFSDEFPDGLLVAQDDINDEKTQNFKLVRWDTIIKKLATN
jgi:3-phytase